MNLIYRQANERVGAFVDHSGNLIDARTGAALMNSFTLDEDEEDLVGVEGARTPGLTVEGTQGTGEESAGALTEGYSFFDSVSRRLFFLS